MKVFNLSEMKKGWFVGDFEPTCLKTKDFEVGCKRYKAGDKEKVHVHKVAQEITVILEGRVLMNGKELKAGDIILLEPGEPADFQVLEDAVTVVVKAPSVAGDKYMIGEA